MRRSCSLLSLLLAALLVAPAAAALPDPWLILPWGDGPGEPGLLPGGHERPAVGPIAIAAGADRVVISDPAHRQLLVLDREGHLVEVVPTSFVAVDLALLDGGGLLALDALGDRVHVRAATGPWRVHPASNRRLAAVAVGPDGAPWAVDALGRAFPVAEMSADAVGLDRAAPLGPGAVHHAAGRRADAHTGEVLLWDWSEPAEVRPPGPALRLPITSDPHLLGTIRPLRVDAHGVLHVLVERLADAGHVEVHVQLRRYDLARRGAELDHVDWTIADVAPVNRYAAVDDAGQLFIMAARPEGLTVWRLAAPARPAGGAR